MALVSGDVTRRRPARPGWSRPPRAGRYRARRIREALSAGGAPADCRGRVLSRSLARPLPPAAGVCQQRPHEQRVILSVWKWRVVGAGRAASRMSNRRLASRVTSAVALLVPVVNTVAFVAPAPPRAATWSPGPVAAVYASSMPTESSPARRLGGSRAPGLRRGGGPA